MAYRSLSCIALCSLLGVATAFVPAARPCAGASLRQQPARRMGFNDADIGLEDGPYTPPPPDTSDPNDIRARRRRLEERDAKTAPSLSSWMKYIDRKDGGATRRELVQFFGGSLLIWGGLLALENGTTIPNEVCDVDGNPISVTGGKVAAAEAGVMYSGSPKLFSEAIMNLKEAKTEVSSAKVYISSDPDLAASKFIRSKALQPQRFGRTCAVLESMAIGDQQMSMRSACNSSLDSLEALRRASQAGQASEMRARSKNLENGISNIVEIVLKQ
jgi:hypothetical protein